jgi:hypothetical protein
MANCTSEYFPLAHQTTVLDMVQDKSLSAIIHQVTVSFQRPNTSTDCCYRYQDQHHCHYRKSVTSPPPPQCRTHCNTAAMVNKSSNSMPALQLTTQIFLQMTLYKHSLSSSLPKTDSASINSHYCLSSPDH